MPLIPTLTPLSLFLHYIFSGCVSHILQRRHGWKLYTHDLFVKMTMKGKLPLLVFLFCSVIVFASVGLGKEDPELEQCKHQCKVQQQFDSREKQECEDRCKKHYQEKQQQRGERDEEGEEEFWNPESPERKLRECQSRCDQKGQRPEQQRECQRRCLEEFRREQEERGGGRDVTVENKKDPEEQYRRCKEGCQRRTQGQEQQQWCQERCDREYRQHQHEGREEERGGGRDGELENKKDPEEKFRQCKEQCQRQRPGREQQQRCEERCKMEYRERQRGGGGNPRHEGGVEREESEGQQEGGNPYVFDDQDFTARLETPQGRVKVLQKFTERSKLLRGIENYRVVILEADPQTFIVPNHGDADAVIFVAKGKGSISLVRQDKRESFNLDGGDLLRVPAGVTVYLINRSNNQKLVLVKLLQPVNTPGHFEAFFGPGGEDPESYYKAFSTELLEAALNTRRDRLQKIFGQQRQGVIIKASEEQIRSMSHHEQGGIWPFGEKSKGSFNLFHKRSSVSNQYGQLFEVNPNDCRDLDELNLGINFANISEGAMIAPYYNSRATKIAIVTNGEGYFQMACPHLSSSEFAGEGRGHGGSEARQHGGGSQGKSSPSYQKVRARLRRGMVYIVPAGHPVTAVASSNQNLEILCFNINARNNEKFFLAGRRNIINQLEKEAKELGFGVPAGEVDEVFKNQDEEFFLKGPRQQQPHEGRAEA